MLQKTRAIVLRTVKYGETSVITTLFTEVYGLQSYLVNGVRSASKKGSVKAALFQPSALLELVAYHNEFKNLQRLKEYKWEYLYQHIFSDVKKNAVALFMIELFSKTLKQPESNADLFYFVEDALKHLDEADEMTTANFPLFFALQLPHFFGFAPNPPRGSIAGADFFLDLVEGRFVPMQPGHPHFLLEDDAATVAEILKARQPAELSDIVLNQEKRRRLLHAMEDFYRLHLPDFTPLKTLPVLKEIMS